MVEWKKLGDCLDFEQPTAYLVNSTEYDDSYSIPVLTAGQSLLLGYTNEKDGIYKASKENPCIIFDDFTTSFHWIDYDFKVKSSAMKMLRPKKEVCFRYVYYAMRCIDFVPGGHQRHWISKYSQFEIPYPSLSEQQRIVGILDTFTASIDNLKEQIAQRRKQYEFYRDQLFYASKADLLEASKRGEVIVKSLDDLGTFTRGRRFVRTDIVPEGVPCIHYGDMYTYYGVSAEETPTHLTKELSSKLRFAKNGDVVIVAAGENDLDIGVGVAWLGKEPVVVHDACFIFENKMNPKYLSHFMRSRNYHQQIRMGVVDGKICSISAKELGRALIAVPSLQEQQRIVSILDTFEASIQNLEAQLSQREKQYDYYRNKLLTFE